MKKRVDWKVLIISFLIVFLIVAGIGSLFTSGETDSEWYASTRSNITPPNWVFPIAWNILFVLIALSLYFVWTSANKNEKKIITIVYGLNFLFNILWSFFFFRLKNPLLGFFDIILVVVTIIAMIFVSWKINKKAAWLLVLYLLWVSFASVLNFLAI
jgi:translocator protein